MFLLMLPVALDVVVVVGFCIKSVFCIVMSVWYCSCWIQWFHTERRRRRRRRPKHKRCPQHIKTHYKISNYNQFFTRINTTWSHYYCSAVLSTFCCCPRSVFRSFIHSFLYLFIFILLKFFEFIQSYRAFFSKVKNFLIWKHFVYYPNNCVKLNL